MSATQESVERTPNAARTVPSPSGRASRDPARTGGGRIRTRHGGSAATPAGGRPRRRAHHHGPRTVLRPAPRRVRRGRGEGREPGGRHQPDAEPGPLRGDVVTVPRLQLGQAERRARPEGPRPEPAALRTLVAGADVFLHNMRPAAVRKLSIDYAALQRGQFPPGLLRLYGYSDEQRPGRSARLRRHHPGGGGPGLAAGPAARAARVRRDHAVRQDGRAARRLRRSAGR